MQHRSWLEAHLSSGWGQLWKFGVVGVLTFGINFASFALLYGRVHLPYALAATLAYAITVACHFSLNKFFTFSARQQAFGRNLPRYGLMLVVNYLITILAQWTTVEELHLTPYFGVVLATVGTAISSFFIMKYFVFRHRLAGT